MRMLFAAAAAVALSLPAVAADTKVNLTGDNTKITFVGAKPDGKHDGGFKTLTGTATVTGDDLTTLKVEVEIDMESIYTDTEKLTAHLKSPDFFGVKQNPKSKFVSTKVAKTDKGYDITGDLTMNGQTKAITFPATIAVAGGGLKINSEFTIDRTQWGMTYGKGKISDETALKVAVDAK
jgi:polyisoprenoid-binding protein YceI